MVDKLTETVEVRTFMVRIHCPNPPCHGILTFDGKERSENGLHGGKPEYRHRCNTCETGYWLKEKFPKIKHEPINSESALRAMWESKQIAEIPPARSKSSTKSPIERPEDLV